MSNNDVYQAFRARDNLSNPKNCRISSYIKQTALQCSYSSCLIEPRGSGALARGGATPTYQRGEFLS